MRYIYLGFNFNEKWWFLCDLPSWHLSLDWSKNWHLSYDKAIRQFCTKKKYPPKNSPFDPNENSLTHSIGISLFVHLCFSFCSPNETPWQRCKYCTSWWKWNNQKFWAKKSSYSWQAITFGSRISWSSHRQGRARHLKGKSFKQHLTKNSQSLIKDDHHVDFIVFISLPLFSKNTWAMLE